MYAAWDAKEGHPPPPGKELSQVVTDMGGAMRYLGAEHQELKDMYYKMRDCVNAMGTGNWKRAETPEESETEKDA